MFLFFSSTKSENMRAEQVLPGAWSMGGIGTGRKGEVVRKGVGRCICEYGENNVCTCM
jgi:hypothetical protein